MISQGRFKQSKHQAGMVLFHTLLMMTLITGLILSQITWINLLWQSVTHLKIKHQEIHQLEEVAIQTIQISNRLNKLSQNCIIEESNLDEIQTRLKARKGCAIQQKNQQYQYFYERLNDFPCLQTRREGKLFGTKHWRLNLMAVSETTRLIQIRIAVISEEILSCRQDRVTYIDTGILSWQII